VLKKSINYNNGGLDLASHISALKRARQNEKRRVRNLHVETTVKSMVKRVRSAVEAKDVEGAQKALAKAIPLIQRANSKGIYHKNTSSRRVSHLTRAVNALKGA
jgi:small subunit ribosomal protein S20